METLMSDKSRCATCGNILPDDISPEAGSCPSCLLNLALSAPDLTTPSDVYRISDPYSKQRGSAMGLSAGMRLDSYEILDSLGSGGMGEVYRGRDTKLDRLVAVKALPDAFVHDE